MSEVPIGGPLSLVPQRLALGAAQESEMHMAPGRPCRAPDTTAISIDAAAIDARHGDRADVATLAAVGEVKTSARHHRWVPRALLRGRHYARVRPGGSHIDGTLRS